MEKTPESLYTLVEYVIQARPDLTERQAVAAAIELQEQCKSYLRKDNGLPSIMRAIYEAGLTDEELDAYWELDYDQRAALYRGL